MAQRPGAPDFLAHRDGDLVGVAVRDLDPGPVHGGYLSGPDRISVRLTEAVPLGHKLALTDIAAGAADHRVRPAGGRRHQGHRAGRSRPRAQRAERAAVSGRMLTGYRRENGAVGIRNHTVILPVDDLSNAAAEAVAKLVPGTLALPHAYGRLQFGADLELTFRTLAGNAANPNVASAVVIGIEPNWTERLVADIAKTGKPVAGFAIERHGDLRTIERAARVAAQFLQDDSERSTAAGRAARDSPVRSNAVSPTRPAASAPARPPRRPSTGGSRRAGRCCSARRAS